jgi:hypothetical protein
MTPRTLRISSLQFLVAAAWFALPLPLARFLTRGGETPWLLCVLLAVEAAWILLSWRGVTGSVLNPYGLFVVVGLLFNANQAFMEIAGWNKGGLLGGQFSPRELVSTISLVMSAFGGLHLGALLAVNGGRLPAPRSSGRDVEVQRENQALRRAGWWMLALSMVPLVVVSQRAVTKVLSGGYMAFLQPTESAGTGSLLDSLAMFAYPGSLALIVGSRGRGAGTWLAICVLLARAGVFLFVGSRFQSALPLVAAAWLWNRAVRPLPRAPLIGAAAALLFVVFPLVRATREVSGQERRSLASVKSALKDVEDPAVFVLAEMGGSMGTITHTMRLVPRPHPFELGEGYAYAALTVVPSLFWSKHPAIARGLPGTWLTEQVDPDYAAIGGSIANSFIAEAYLNFGWAAPLLMILLGFAIVRLWLWSEAAGPAGLLLIASFLPSLLMYTRNDATYLFRPMLWYGIGPYLLVRLLEGNRDTKATPLARP